MILKLDLSKIELTQTNLNHIIEKFNLLVECYTMAVQAQSASEEVVEQVMTQRDVYEERALKYSLQLKHLATIEALN